MECVRDTGSPIIVSAQYNTTKVTLLHAPTNAPPLPGLDATAAWTRPPDGNHARAGNPAASPQPLHIFAQFLDIKLLLLPSPCAHAIVVCC